MKNLIVTVLILSFSSARGQNTAERLGHEKDDILLIVHADDLGVAHAENIASIEAYEQNAINSASIMVPCPWFPEIAQYAVAHPEFDLGLHLTLTAEWKDYKWDGVSSANTIPSLLSEQNFFFASSEEVAKSADLKQVEAEVRAQVQRAIDFGIKPSHLDSHMGSLFQSPDLLKIYQKIGREFRIPVFIPFGALKNVPVLVEAIEPDQILVDQLAMIGPEVSPEDWEAYYLDILRSLQPGLNEILVHLAYDNAEMQAVTKDHPDFGASWRQRDFEVVTGNKFRDLIAERNIKLVTWRQVQEVQYPD